MKQENTIKTKVMAISNVLSISGSVFIMMGCLFGVGLHELGLAWVLACLSASCHSLSSYILSRAL
jgi:hypothetical protein